MAKIGYQGVEFAGYHGDRPEAFREMLNRNGLKCCGTHIGLDTLTGEALKHTVEFNQILGNQFLIVPSLPQANMASLRCTVSTRRRLLHPFG